MKIDVERLQIMNIEPGDTLVITLKDVVSREEMDRTHTILSKLYPFSKVLVMDDGAEIKIVRGLK